MLRWRRAHDGRVRSRRQHRHYQTGCDGGSGRGGRGGGGGGSGVVVGLGRGDGDGGRWGGNGRELGETVFQEVGAFAHSLQVCLHLSAGVYLGIETVEKRVVLVSGHDVGWQLIGKWDARHGGGLCGNVSWVIGVH